MKTSPEIDKVAPAFLAAQKAMAAAAKSATNPHFKSKYSDLATVIDAVKSPLNEAGIGFLQTVTADTTGVFVKTSLMHESGQWFEETLYLPIPQQTPQAYGSGITYAKRYSLQSMCGLPSEDDDGEKASQPEKADAHRVEAKPKRELTEEIENTLTTRADLTEKEKDALRTHAAQMTKTHEAGGNIKTYYEAQHFDDAQKMQLWLYLTPPVRAVLKREPLASQP